MEVRDVLSVQLEGSLNLLSAHLPASTQHWEARAFTGSSLPGFVLWHCARIIDWGIHTAVRRVPEVAASDQWHERVRYDLGHGAGLTDAEADSAAATVNPDDLGAYVVAMRSPVLAWLAGATDAELREPVDLRSANAVNPRYGTDAAWGEVEALHGIAAWQLILRPCVSHIRVHVGELETLLAAMNRGAGALGARS